MSKFPIVLAIAAIVFAISTMITWCYYGETAFGYLFGGNLVMKFVYRIIFILFIVAGAVMTLSSIVNLADGPFFALCVINLIGVYALLPVVRRELKSYREYVRSVKNGVPGPPAASVATIQDDGTVALGGAPGGDSGEEPVDLLSGEPGGDDIGTIDLAAKYGRGDDGS